MSAWQSANRRLPRLRQWTWLAGAALLLAGCATGSAATVQSAATPPAPHCGVATATPTHYRHVVWIWFENRNYDQIIGNAAQAPYFNKVAAACGQATDYHAITHPSLPNYLSATAGGRQGPTFDCVPKNCPQSGPSIFTLLNDSGKTWKAYAADMPGNCWLNDHAGYAPRHNPAVYFLDLRASCAQHDVPLGSTRHGPLADDLKANRLASFTYIVPNLCQDTHSCGINAGDRWLATWLPMITSTRAYRDGSTAVFITFDEGYGNTFGEDCVHSTDPSCRVALIAASRSIAHGERVTQSMTPYSLLRTTEELLGLAPLLGHAAQATSMTSALVR